MVLWDMVKTFHTLLLLCLLYLTASPGYGRAQNHVNVHGTYDVENFLPADYNGSSQNWFAGRDSNGTLFFANSGGLLEYDGVNWRLTAMPGGQALFSLKVLPDGTIWVGGHDEIGFFKADPGGKLVYNSLSPTLPDSLKSPGRIRKIVLFGNNLFFRSHKYLLKWDHKKWTVWKPRTSFYKPFVVNGRFFIWEAKKGLLELKKEHLALVSGGEFFKKDAVTAILPYSGKRLLIATWDKGFFLYDSASIHPLPLQTDIPRIIDAAVLSGGRLAVLTYSRGLFIFNKGGSLAQRLDSRSGLADDHGNHLLAGSGGDIWLSNNLGISRVAGELPYTVFKNNRGYSGKIRGITKHKGKIYLATSDGLFMQTDGAGLPFRPVEGGNASAWYLLRAGESLLAATNDGVMAIENGRARLLSTDQSKTFFLLPSRHRLNTVFCGTEDGLARLRFIKGRWQFAGKIKGLENEVRNMVEDTNGLLWLGTRNAGYLRGRIENGQLLFRPLTMNNSRRAGANAGLARLKNGTFFFSRLGRLNRYDTLSGRFFADTTLLGKPARVFNISHDPAGRLWVLRHRDKRNQYHYARWDGGKYLFDEEPFSKPLPRIAQTVYIENDSISWFGAGSMLIRYKTRINPGPGPGYPTQIRRVYFQDSVVFHGHKPAENMRVPYAFPHPNNALRFEYARTSFLGAEGNRYRYYLEGYDPGWSAWSTETQKNYTNLYEGDYRFHVQSMDVYGRTSPAATFSFSILPPLYRTPTAYIIYLLLLVTAVITVDRVRSLQIKRKTERETTRKLQELERINHARGEARRQIRKNTSIDFHDELGHILTKLSLMTELARRASRNNNDVSRYLTNISRGIVDLTTGVKDFVWMLDSEKDTLYDTLIRIKEFGDSLFEYSSISFKTPGFPQSFDKIKTDTTLRRNMTMIFKEAMNNCLKYSGAGEAELFVISEPPHLEVRFRDNGGGFKPDRDGGGYGLGNMKRRARKIGATLAIESQPGKTVVILKLKPLSSQNTPDEL